VVTLSTGGQLTLRVDGISSIETYWVGEQTFTPSFPGGQTYFPGVPGFADCEMTVGEDTSVDAADGLHPLGLCGSATHVTYVLTFHDPGVYTLGVGPVATF